MSVDTIASPDQDSAHAGSTPRRDVVFTFSYETYVDAVRRGMMRPPDRLLGTLMHSPSVARLVVANPFRWLPTQTLKRVVGEKPEFPATPVRVLHTPTRLLRKDPTDLRRIEEQYRAYDRSIAHRAELLEMTQPVVITTNPLVAGFAPLEWAQNVMFFARDDWSSSPARREYWPAYVEAYRRIAESGRMVTAVSQQIIDRIAPTGPHAVVPNGVEVDEWTGPQPSEPAWMAKIPHPRALYVGTLDSRLDVDGIEDFARRAPHVHTILMGPQPDPKYIAPLKALPNVHIRPSVGRAELVATMRNVDLCLLAHRRTPLTEAMSPLKIYEYLASGCPVISIDLPPIHDISDRVIVVPGVGDFAEVLETALALGPASEEERLGFVHGNSWSARHRTIMDMAFGTPAR